jgi:hypothetical protein
MAASLVINRTLRDPRKFSSIQEMKIVRLIPLLLGLARAYPPTPDSYDFPALVLNRNGQLKRAVAP